DAVGDVLWSQSGRSHGRSDYPAMAADPSADARFILDTLQATVDARDADALVSLFDDPAVLIGTAGDGRNPDALRRYLTAVATQPEALRWDWRVVTAFHQSQGVLGIEACGEFVLID